MSSPSGGSNWARAVSLWTTYPTLDAARRPLTSRSPAHCHVVHRRRRARDRLKAASKLLTGMVMGAQIKDKTAGEEALRASGLDWTIVYATKLTNGPKTEPTVVPETTKVGVSHKISRADVASFLLQAATDGLYSRRAVIITG